MHKNIIKGCARAVAWATHVEMFNIFLIEADLDIAKQYFRRNEYSFCSYCSGVGFDYFSFVSASDIKNI